MPSFESRSAELIAAAKPRACAIGGGLVGLFGGWFGLCAGILIGTMLDVARLEAAERSRIAAFLREPDAADTAVPAQAARCYWAAASLAFRGEWPGPRDFQPRRALWERFLAEDTSLDSKSRREAERAAEVASRESAADLPALARYLATAGDSGARRALACWAFALAALGSRSLGSSDELGLRAALGDCGLGAAQIAAARERAFPGARDPWSVLGLAPGAGLGEIKRSYRRLSRSFHPDAAPGDDGARFRELGEAYAALTVAEPAQAPRA